MNTWPLILYKHVVLALVASGFLLLALTTFRRAHFSLNRVQTEIFFS